MSGLGGSLFTYVFQVALVGATSLVARNQMQPVVMKALFDTFQKLSGCVAVASGECFAS